MTQGWKPRVLGLVAYLASLSRSSVLGLALALCCLWVAVFTLLLSKDSEAAKLLLDYSSYSIFPYPFTIQNLMYLFFFFCLGDLFVRWVVAQRELGYLQQAYLPEDDEVVLQPAELGSIRERVIDHYDAENGFLPRLIDQSILQFQTSRSVDQTVSVLNSTLELIMHRVDLRYSAIRYVVWVIPTIGFIGTVVGISRSLILIDPGKMDLPAITGGLAIAFYTTIMALVLSAVLVFLLHVVQKSEEMALNQAGDYCLKNLINRLYSGSAG
ncbi:MAG: MotA/TolQ/ExbB proton channel family protein [Halioglobus sp.]|nr:MotA/TolQ/ExbB proton channel family protein [Halioglobus sp.]